MTLRRRHPLRPPGHGLLRDTTTTAAPSMQSSSCNFRPGAAPTSPSRALCLTLLTVLLVLSSADPAAATICLAGDTSNLRYVRGVVVLRDRDVTVPLPGAAVSISKGKFTAETSTDEDGYFAFSSLEQGDYQIRASLEGFYDAAGEVSVRRRGDVDRVLLIALVFPFDDCPYVQSVPWRTAREIQLKAKRRQRPRGQSF